ncbi:MAG: hypothetical protein QF903_04550 [Planctomycetota bacterium]|jgi:hypothetical protein|nr:hypothetical protein [Planctomycetota bacterium]MDP6762425.1 hypothetical protein [Planctomycetota bacterium]MDP6988728.1 hypothetical protein [Planctomycetota bacterium]
MDPPPPTVHRREALTLVVLSCAGLLGLAPSRGATFDPVAVLAWAALSAPALGVLAGALLPATTAPLVCLPWWPAVSAASLRAGAALPDPTGAWWALAGLFGLGWGAGRLSGRHAVRLACAALLLTGLLACLPGGGGRLARPWPPRVAARLLDLSPVAVVTECAGLDFMRHPEVYGPVGTMDIGPQLRGPWRAPVAAPSLLLLGAALAGLARLRAAR